MAKHEARTVELNGKFVRREAAEAVRTFFKPVVGTYNLVIQASNPPVRHVVKVAPNSSDKKRPT